MERLPVATPTPRQAFNPRRQMKKLVRQQFNLSSRQWVKFRKKIQREARQAGRPPVTGGDRLHGGPV